MIPIPRSRRFVHYFLSITVLLAVGVLLVHAAPSTPDKNITVVTKEQQIPQWKKLWDEARMLAQQQEIEAAVTRYLEVLDIKPHIEEVKWELSKIYLTLKQFDKALVILESLLEAAPEKIDYLVSAGEAAMQLQKVSQAGRYYGQALALDPAGSLSELALLGMTASLSAQGKNDLAIPLMEQLFQRGVVSQELLLDLAQHFSARQDFGKGSFYYRELLGKYEVEDTIISEAAYTFEKSAYLDEAAEQWEKYLQDHPEHLEFHIKLADYYQKKEKFQDALRHMLYLLEQDVERERYLLPVARIYLYELGRTDRALAYFEQYRDEFPDGLDVSKEISGLQMIMANDLLAIVENDGVWMLWRDLAELMPDRLGIYRAMADMLREMGREKEDELIEILKIISVHEPEDSDILNQLVHLYIKTGRTDECRGFLNSSMTSRDNKAELFLLRAQCEYAAKDDLTRLKTYVSYLKLNPGDMDTRVEAMRLAGSLGFVEQLEQIYRNSGVSEHDEMSDIHYTYAVELMKNGLARNAEKLLSSFERTQIGPEKLMVLAKNLTMLDLQQNRPYKAEQGCRKFATHHPDIAEGYLLLSGFFITRQDIANARFWHDAMDMHINTLSPAQKSILFYQNLMIDRALTKVDVYQRAVQYLNAQLKTNRIVAEDIAILLFAAKHYVQTNRFGHAIRLIDRFRPKFKGVDSIVALRVIAQMEKAGKGRSWSQLPLDGVSLSERIAVAQQLRSMERYEDAEAMLTSIEEELPDSVRTKVMLAENHVSLLDYLDANKIYRDLAQRFAEETYFSDQLFRLEDQLGAAESIFQEFSIVVDDSGRKHAIQPKHEFLDYPEIKLMWARALWSADRWEESLDAYALLDTEMNRNLDLMKAELETIPQNRLQTEPLDEDHRLIFDDPEVIDKIMSNEFTAEHLTGEITAISSRYYDSYRWGKVINKEMTAKSSLKAKEFYQAEIDYKELFREEADVTEHSYADLATVYGRLGRYQEETELLEKIKETNTYYPDLPQITEKTIRRRQPNLFVESTYYKEEGRDGFIDISKKNAGLGLMVRPTLYQETGFTVGRNEYGDSSASTLAKSTTLLGNYKVQFSDAIEGIGIIGAEDFDEDVDTYLLYDFLLKGTLEQRVEMYGGLKQEPVDDTIDSLLSHTYRREMQLGFSLDYYFGMFFGFDIDFYDYSDDNEGEQYYLWSSYRWFGERSSVDVTYSYLNLQHHEANEITAEDTDNAALPYWSPGDYWKHRLSGMYRMELWPTGRLQSGTGSFTAKYGIGYEKGDSLIQEIDMNILLEITASFLVKGTFSTVLSEDYDMLKGFVSFVYRW